MAEQQYCLYCGKALTDIQKRRNNKCCSRSCSAKLYRDSMTEEQKQLHSKKISEATKAAMARPEVREHLKQVTKEWANVVCKTESYRKHMSEVLKKVYENQEVRDKVSDAVRKSLAKPEVREKLSKSVRKAYENPELRKKVSERTKQALAKPEVKERQSKGIRKAYKLNGESIKAKISKTKISKNTAISSQQEIEGFNLIKQIFPDAIHHYSSELYPFICDYYIPSLDLYIEGNFGWYHHGRPFANTEEDLQELAKLKDLANEKFSKTGKESRYHKIIYTWTDLDVRKRQIAVKNKLNYLEVYSLTELKEIFNL